MNITEQESYICFLQDLEEKLVEKLCGERYSRAKSACRRVKTRVKRICTRLGKFDYRFVYVRDKIGRLFSPLLEYLGIPKYKRMSDDLRDLLRDKASKMTYADAAEDIANSFGFSLHKQTLWRMNQESEGLTFVEPDEGHIVLLADGTKIRSNQGGHHKPKAVMSIKPGSKRRKPEKGLIAFGVEESWEELAKEIDFSSFKVLVADAEPGLRHNLVKPHMRFQLCHQHAIRDLSFYLWKDGLPNLARNEFMKPFKRVLYTVQSSTEKYFVDKDKARLRRRVLWAHEQIDILATKIERMGLTEASGFLERNKKYLFTSAALAIREGLRVPWTTNQIERLMKELGKRTKKRSMRWSASGLGVILRAVLKRYFLPPKNRNYKKIFGDTSNRQVVKF